MIIYIKKYGCYIAKLRKYLKLDEDVEILNIHGEGFRLVEKKQRIK
jgi:DNA-binding response OmpR family regulator